MDYGWLCAPLRPGRRLCRYRGPAARLAVLAASLLEGKDLLFESVDPFEIFLRRPGPNLGRRAHQKAQRDQHEQHRVHLAEDVSVVEEAVHESQNSERKENSTPNQHNPSPLELE